MAVKTTVWDQLALAVSLMDMAFNQDLSNYPTVENARGTGAGGGGGGTKCCMHGQGHRH